MANVDVSRDALLSVKRTLTKFQSDLDAVNSHLQNHADQLLTECKQSVSSQAGKVSELEKKVSEIRSEISKIKVSNKIAIVVQTKIVNYRRHKEYLLPQILKLLNFRQKYPILKDRRHR